MSEPIVWLTIFVLSVFVGVEVISKVSSTLHTPLMSGANAIHGIILLGAILVSGYAETTAQLVVGLVAVVLATVNMVGGFVVADRVAAVCFILALKGLSSPRTARGGNLVGAFGAVLACVVVFLYAGLDHVVPILVAIVLGTAVGLVGARRVQMTQMPQLVALFNGVGGGAAALVALLELGDLVGTGPAAFTLVATAFTILV